MVNKYLKNIIGGINMKINTKKNTHFIIFKDDEIEFRGYDTYRWRPEVNKKIPNTSIVHYLFDDNNYKNELSTQLDSKKVFEKDKYFIVCADDLTTIERRACDDFICKIYNLRSNIVDIPFSMICGIQSGIQDYISITASKRCICVSEYKQGELVNEKFVTWNEGIEKVESILQYRSLPKYMFDPNKILEQYRSLCDYEIKLDFTTKGWQRLIEKII